jgi:hypothetical protein
MVPEGDTVANFGPWTVQCRQRWFFCLDPKINKDPLTDEEYEIILNEQARIDGSTSLKCLPEWNHLDLGFEASVHF